MIGRYSDVMSFDVILDRMLDRIPETVDKREGSVIYDALAPAAAELAKAYMECDVIMDETFVDTASLQYLLLRCKERGITVKEESAAVVQGEFTPSALTIPTGTRFNCESVNYVVTEKITDGKYKLQAETLGSAGNQYSGILLPIQPVNGLRTAKITGVLIPGEDGDTTDSLRKKYYASVNGEAFGGNIADYIERVNQIAGVGGARFPLLERRRHSETDDYFFRLFRTVRRSDSESAKRDRSRNESGSGNGISAYRSHGYRGRRVA